MSTMAVDLPVGLLGIVVVVVPSARSEESK